MTFSYSKRRLCQVLHCLPLLNGNYAHNCMVNIMLQSCISETMRTSVVLLFAFLVFVLVVAYAADEVSVYDNIATYLSLECV